ncbi:MAG: D-sedoheptulose 7-phosphate isomerase [archaeon GW2011_AR17]|nr:MAG: D-sedoheptulose 7-phosphate isomerase [archaeon GW2011_AR17]MBS3154178.1 SIS domain-containing protein [Candidatus Woesearchaeota archaeon]HIH14785.1 SIS domain-containing protein [Nanoarchaeota archaeon]HIH58663.1 SIS domain-containing protein [Nanoarchaeota archaeon]HII14452.1 SIS domain-containing protein [Nanoarchaeota archaeon]
MEERIKRELTEATLVTQALVNKHIQEIKTITELVIHAYQNGGRLIMFGNGGSAADAQHIVAELVNYLYMPGRPMLDALALTVNTSVLTAIGNDVGYENIFARQIESLVTEKDVVIAISTSGNSPNILKAIEAAKKVKAKVIGLTGKTGGKMAAIEMDILVKIPTADVARIQEAHMKIGHIMCSLVEKELFQEKRFK